MHVIATAGHVDHGKSTLVRALTGMEPDRWAEERRRGMTIDLGFAWTTLARGEVIAFVDVPGHQRFIANMLAGVGPVPAVMFVVAADEGWRHQSDDHLAALRALDVRHGVLAVTRADLGDADLAIAEARDRLAGTGLASMEAVAVSAVTGTGLDRLRSALGRLVATLPLPATGPARLWIDRTFSVPGAGTVVTGTLGSGRIAVGDELALTPTNHLVRVRGLQSLKKAVPHSEAVARLAVNLRYAKAEDIHRGQALVTPGAWAGVDRADVRLLHPVDHLPPQMVMHLGAAAIPVHIRHFASDTARLTLATPLPMHIGERALLRDPGQHRIAAGVIVLDTMPPPLRRRGAAIQRAADLSQMSGHPDPATEIRRRGAVRRSQLAAAGVLPAGKTAPPGVIEIGDWLVAAQTWADWRSALLAAVDGRAATDPLSPGLPRQAAAHAAGLVDPQLLDPLVAGMPELVPHARGIRRTGTAVTFPPEIDRALTQLRSHLAANPFAAPDNPEITALGLSDQHLAAAAHAGILLRIHEGIFVSPAAPAEAIRRLSALDQPFTLSEARQALHTTRRVAMPLLELLDQSGATVRIDNLRRMVRRRPA